MDQELKTEPQFSAAGANEENRKKTHDQSVLGPVAKAIVLALVVTTLISLASPHHWFADLLANLRMQQLIGLIVAFGLCLKARKRRLSCLAIILTAIHAPWLKPALPTSTSDAAASITITFANTLTSNWNVDAIAEDLLHNDPDVIAVLELSNILQAKLAKELSSTYPHSIVRPLDHSNFGIGLYSNCLLYTSPSPRDRQKSRMPSSA